MIFINFKTYPNGTGAKAVELAKIMEKVSVETGVKCVPVVQLSDIKEIRDAISLDVWVQHIDPIEFGAHTGSVLPEAVVENGVIGTFLNHSEHKFSDFENLSLAVKRAKEIGLMSLIFAADVGELRKVSELAPDFVSYEPPELVGSTTDTVATSHPDVIAKAAEISREFNLPLIVGAGVHSTDDVKTSLKLGAIGIAVATDIVKAEDPEKELRELVKGFL